MARAKRTSRAIIKAQRRAAGMESIKVDLDLGNGLSLKTFLADIEKARDKETEYNKRLSSLDQFYNEMLEDERKLAAKTSKVLQAIALIYGRNSSEYEMVGGTRSQERRRANRAKAKTESAA
jgi:hypothetical protein